MNQIGHTINHNLFLSTPSARRATGGAGNAPRDAQFLSTPSARRATFPCLIVMSRPSNFYPRPPRGGRRISTIHRKEKFIFLSTPSARRATGN